MKSGGSTKQFRVAVVFGLIAWTPLLTSAFAQTAASLACSPSVIAGGSGGSATCTVTLSAAAPSGGTVVTLTSSLMELAASHPTVTVPAGQTTADFIVATNPGYRRYSQLSFSPSISASAGGTTRSATLNVTAQPRPADFSSGSQAGANTQWQGLMCGGIAPIGGYPDILYNCSAASGTGFGTCTFFQECSFGCRRVPPNGGTFNDFCAGTGPNPVALSRNRVIGGDRVPATIVAEAPAGSAPAQETAVPRIIDPNFNSTRFPQTDVVFPTGATTVGFEIATSYVPAIQFTEVGGFWFNDAVAPLLITNGRGGHAWLVLLPPDPAPAVAIPTLGDFRITGSNPVTGGQSSIGQLDLSGLSRAGGPTITLTSSHPDIVPATSVVAPANDRVLGFQVSIPTNPPAADTDVTVTATDGRYRFSAILTVRAPSPPAVLAGLSVSPTSVVGGNRSTGTVTLSGPQSTATVVQVSIIDSAPATLPTNDSPCPPSSRCHNVTVPAGTTSASFTIETSPVTSQFNLNVFADLDGSPGQGALLLITPGAPGGSASELKSPSANVAESRGDGNGFESSPSNAHADDAASAADMNSGRDASTSCTSTSKDRHRFFNYGFAIPAGSTIAGIEVRLDARADSTSGAPKMCVQLSWDGGTTWTAARSTATLGTSMGTFTLGGPSDTWGRTWSAANLADASFRVRVINVSSSTSRDFFLDWIAVRPHLATFNGSTNPSSITVRSSPGGSAARR